MKPPASAKNLPAELCLSFAFIVAAVLLFTGLSARAQFNSSNFSYGERSSNYGLTFSADADVPMHNLKGVYKAGPAFDAGLIRDFKNFTFSVNLGYRVYQPRYNAYVDHDDYGNADGTVSYSNYTSIAIYTSIVYNLALSPSVTVIAGINSGAYITSYSYNRNAAAYDDLSSFSDHQSLTESQSYFAPKLGLNFAVSENLRLGVEAKYNVFSTATYTYNTTYSSPDTGTSYSSWASGLTLTYRFP